MERNVVLGLSGPSYWKHSARNLSLGVAASSLESRLGLIRLSMALRRISKVLVDKDLDTTRVDQELDMWTCYSWVGVLNAYISKCLYIMRYIIQARQEDNAAGQTQLTII